MEAGPGKVTSYHRPQNACTYSVYEYRLHRNGISILNAILGLFFCGLFCLDLLGNIHRIEEGANPASFRLFCLCEICLCTYMRVQNNRGNATQVRLSFLVFGLMQFWGIAEFLTEGTKIPTVFLHGDILTHLLGTVPVMVLGMTGRHRALLAAYVSAHVLACAAFHHYLGGLQLPLALMRSAAVHITCSGVFLAVKRKVGAAYAAYLASHTSLAGAPLTEAGGSKRSSPGSADPVPGFLAAREGRAADSVETKAPYQNLEEELQAVASNRARAKGDAAVMQQGRTDDAEHAGAAADGLSACADFFQQAKEPVRGPSLALGPAPVSGDPAWPVVGTPPLSYRRRKFCSRSDQQFQVHLKIHGDLHPEDLQADLAGELEAMMRLSASGQPRNHLAIRSGSIIVSFTWCSGLSLSQEQLQPLRSMARRPASQVLQTIQDMVPKWIGGTCLSGLIEHGAVVTVQVDGLLAHCTWDAHTSSWRVDGNCTLPPLENLPVPTGPLLTSSTTFSSSDQALHYGVALLPAPLLLLPPISHVLGQEQQQQQCQRRCSLHRAGTGPKSWQLQEMLMPENLGSLSARESFVLKTAPADKGVDGTGEAAACVRLVADVHGLGDSVLTGWQPQRRTSEAMMDGAGAAPAAQQSLIPAALKAPPSTGASAEAGMDFQLVARAGKHFVPLDIISNACAAGGLEGINCAAMPAAKEQPHRVEAALFLPPSLACTSIPLLLHLDLWRGSACLASSSVMLLPHHLEAVALELHALADSEVVAEEPEREAMTEEGGCMAATRACKGGAEDMRAAPAAESAFLDKANAPRVPGQACASVWQEGQLDRQGMRQQQPEQESAQSFMQDLMQDLVDFAEFCEQRRHCTSSQAAMMEAIGADLMDYACVSHMPALCQYLEQLSARRATNIPPPARPSRAEADEPTANHNSLLQQVLPLQLSSKQQQTDSERWGSRSGRGGAPEARVLAKTSNGETCRRGFLAMSTAVLMDGLVMCAEAVWRLSSLFQRVFLQNWCGGKNKAALSKKQQ